MNRIILIGNGFDRSLGVPTGYGEFLSYLFKKEATRLLETGNGISKGRGYFIENEVLEASFSQSYLVSDLDEQLKEANFDYVQYSDRLKKNPNTITTKWKNPFVNFLFNQYQQLNWVNLEKDYFNYLCGANRKIALLNEGMEFLLDEIHNYLISFSISYNHRQHGYFKRAFFSNALMFDPSVNDWIDNSNSFDDNVIFINFNYTNFLWALLKSNLLLDKSEIYQIHGRLSNRQGLIFGYGNENHPEYTRIEGLEDNRYLKYIKSSHYAKSSDYQGVLYHLDKDYEVYVYGLSCGLSDQVLLNEILESNNCKQIRIFYHGTLEKNNFTETYNNISRSFKDKSKLRKKVITIRGSDSIKQFNL